MNWKDELEEICGEEYIEAVEALIESLLKKQRENCAKELFKKTERYNGDMVSEMDVIKNAPEPGAK